MQFKKMLSAFDARESDGFARPMSEAANQNTGIAAVGPTGGPLSALRLAAMAPLTPLPIEADVASLTRARQSLTR